MPINLQGHNMATHPHTAWKETIYNVLSSAPTGIPCWAACPHIHVLTQASASSLPMWTHKPHQGLAGAYRLSQADPHTIAVLQGLWGDSRGHLFL